MEKDHLSSKYWRKGEKIEKMKEPKHRRKPQKRRVGGALCLGNRHQTKASTGMRFCNSWEVLRIFILKGLATRSILSGFEIECFGNRACNTASRF